ncbi:MAG: hypothetical protein F2842_08970 [Actinobacteria bacterium]|uniref:Unannotated protein n=1 Tax=freshwater metagenome TaxID=449393 RepID=A0A6J7KV73_9ZZZZ|nr:hypothetical protein [Actinomycetota bacterium]
MSSKKGGQRRPGNPANRSGTPATSSKPTPATTGLSMRRKFERRSAPFILFLHQLPRWAFPLLMAVFLVAGLLIPIAWLGGVLLLALSLFLVWLTILSWPVLSVSGRLLRSVTIAAALAVTYARFTGSL